MTDDDLAATCIADEAANQPYAGKVAVGIVILNRMAKKYSSDGTVPGTVEKWMQFSGFWNDFEAGRYQVVVHNQVEEQLRAEHLFEEYSSQPIWPDCVKAWADAKAWKAGQPLSFTPGPQFRKLTKDTVLYFNPRICKPPPWAKMENLDAVIFQHDFYHA